MTVPLERALLLRIEATGDKSPAIYNFAADIIEIAASAAEAWCTKRLDDAARFPDVLDESAKMLRQMGRKHE